MGRPLRWEGETVIYGSYLASSKQSVSWPSPSEEIKSKLSHNRRSVGQSILVSGQYLGSATNIPFTVMEIQLRQLPVCYYETARALLGIASAVWLWSVSLGTHEHILLSQPWESPNLEGTVPVSISLRNRTAQLYPLPLGYLFVTSYDSQCYCGGIPAHLHKGLARLARISSNVPDRPPDRKWPWTVSFLMSSRP
jgi:hypothetical protein